MELSIIQLRDELENIADKHRMVNGFFFGDFNDAINRDAAEYPLMVCTLQPGSFVAKASGVSIAIMLCDKYNEGNFNQMDEIYSDLMRVMGNVKNTFMSPRFIDLLTIETGAVEPFNNRGGDVTCGWLCTVTFEILDYELWCASPYDNYNFDAPSTSPIICDDAYYTLQDEDGGTISTGDIVSGGSENITAPNGDITVNTTPYGDVLSGGTTNVEVVDQDGSAVGSLNGSNQWEVNVGDDDLFLYFSYESGDDTIDGITIDTNSAGTITSVNSTGLTSVVIEVNGTPETVPFALVDTDTVEITFDAAGSDGQIIFTGTY